MACLGLLGLQVLLVVALPFLSTVLCTLPTAVVEAVQAGAEEAEVKEACRTATTLLTAHQAPPKLPAAQALGEQGALEVQKLPITSRPGEGMEVAEGLEVLDVQQVTGLVGQLH